MLKVNFGVHNLRDNRGDTIVELINNHNMVIINDSNIGPTYLSTLGKKLDRFDIILWFYG